MNHEDLIEELRQAREEQRSIHNQILQVLMIVGTILGVLFGADFLIANTSCTSLNPLRFEGVKAIFYLTCIVFCVAFAYLVTCGTKNVLIYHFIQDIEDQLHILEKKINRTTNSPITKKSLRWYAYLSSIITRHPLHIRISHGFIYFICYSFAVIGSILFASLLIYYEYKLIDSTGNLNKTNVNIALYIMIIVSISTILAFIRITIRGKEVSQRAKTLGINNRIYRISQKSNDEMKTDNKELFRLIIYFIFHRLKDLHKQLIIVCSFILTNLITGKSLLDFSEWKHLLLTLIVFEWLLYQARYQINDIRSEELDDPDNPRLISKYTKNKAGLIKYSFSIAIFKIIGAISLIICYGGIRKKELILGAVLLFIITVIYEFLRTIEKRVHTKQLRNIYSYMIFIMVGIGYPLRAFMGIIIAYAENTPFPTFLLFLSNNSTSCILFILLFFAFWLYGCFSCILAWTHRYIKKYKEKETIKLPIHYTVLGNRLTYKNNTLRSLRDRGKLTDIWNILYILSFLILLIASIFYMNYICNHTINWVLIIDIVILIFIFLQCTIFANKSLKRIMNITNILCIIKVVMYYRFYLTIDILLIIAIIQALFVTTYYIIRYYNGNFIKLVLSLKKKFKAICIFIIGKEAYNIISKTQSK